MVDPFSFFDIFDPSDVEVDTDSLEGVENGVFNGNEAELEELSEAGMIDGTEHIFADDIVRDMAMRNEFLESIGLDQVPEGYEVHHIIPLSEGGVDSPENMVILTEEEHAQITAAHRDFYEWNK